MRPRAIKAQRRTEPILQKAISNAEIEATKRAVYNENDRLMMESAPIDIIARSYCQFSKSRGLKKIIILRTKQFLTSTSHGRYSMSQSLVAVENK